jgi:hypothetical protein
VLAGLVAELSYVDLQSVDGGATQHEAVAQERFLESHRSRQGTRFLIENWKPIRHRRL